MEKKKRKTYERPMSSCMVVMLESTICTGSEFVAQSPHGNGIEAHQVNESFESASDFSNPENGGWDLGS